MAALIIYLFVIITIFLILFIISSYDSYKYDQKNRKNNESEKMEIDNWLKNQEEIHRNTSDYPEDWGMRRKYIAKISNFTCNDCGKYGWLGFHIHHKIPLKKGGNNSLDNLVYLCRDCHENYHPHMVISRLKKKEMYKKFRRYNKFNK